MGFFKKAFDFFVFSSTFIAFCAIGMAYQTATLFHLKLSPSLYLFTAAGTLCSYNFHWIFTPPSLPASSKNYWSYQNKPLHILLAIVSGLASMYLLFQLLEHWKWLAFSGIFTFLYSAPKIPFAPFTSLKKIAVAKTVYLAFAWMHVTTLLPLLIGDENLSASAILFSVNRFFFIYAICILFDYRDRESDRRESIRSLVTSLTERGIDELFYGSVVVTLFSNLLLLLYFSWPVVLALLLPVLALILLYPSSKKTFSDYRYYFVLDGLMMVSAPLVVLAKFATQFFKHG